jgi:hypothetical protein
LAARAARPLGDEAPLLLGQSRVEVQHEGIGIGPEFGGDEWHPLRHEAGNEGHVPRQAIELGDQHCASLRAGRRQGCGELGPAIQRIGSPTCLGFRKLGNDREVQVCCAASRSPGGFPVL